MNENSGAMRGLWLENSELRLRTDIPLPEILPGEALIRVVMAGICQTDLELREGYYPFSGVPGHEFVGRIELAPERPSWEGRRVVGEINVVCRKCPLCLRGLSNHCLNRSVLGIIGKDGAFAEYLTLPVANLYLIPDCVSDEAAVFAEPLAASLQIQQQLQIRPTDSILVIGAGKLGQLIARTLQPTGCRLKVMARHSSQARLLSQSGIDLVDEKRFPEHAFDSVIEASGTARGLLIARSAVRPKGVIVLKSTYKGKVSLNLSEFVVDEITIIGSRCGPFLPAVNLLEQGLIDPTPLVSETFPLSEGIQAFGKASNPGVLKVLLQMQ